MGTYTSAAAAAQAYDAAAVAIKGPTARTNFSYPFPLQSLVNSRDDEKLSRVGLLLALGEIHDPSVVVFSTTKSKRLIISRFQFG